MGSNLRSQEAIRHGESETRSFNDIMEAASTMGWHTFDQSLLRAHSAGLITGETALSYANNKGKIRQALDQYHKQQGAHVEDVSGLKLDIIKPIKIPTEAEASEPAPATP